MNTNKTPEREGASATFAGAVPAPTGSVYEAEVPDTLDLAEHARLAINALMEGPSFAGSPGLRGASGQESGVRVRRLRRLRA